MKLLSIRSRRQRHEQPVDDRLFCRLPFTEINIMEDGNVFPNCCPDWVDFPLGNLHTQSLDDIWNGPNAQKMRQSMLDGDLRYCDANWCPHIQAAKAGVDDFRVARHDNLARLDLPPEALAHEVVMTTKPTNVGMHYDSSCNLACPSCRRDIETVGGDDYDQMARLHDVVEHDVITDAEMISLTGTGDPFASKFLRDFLQNFDRSRYPKLQVVHLHTNAIMWTPRMWARMPGLHELRVSTDISIDAATADTYHVVRRPARWDTLMENLEFIATIPNLETLGISMTVSKLNLGELAAFHDLGRKVQEMCPEKYVFVEYKRVRRRGFHNDEEWSELALEDLPPAGADRLIADITDLDQRRSAGVRPEIRSNLGEFLDLGY